MFDTKLVVIKLQLMKYLLILSALIFSTNVSLKENTNTERVLKAWLEMQNTGTKKAVEHFIQNYYDPSLLQKIESLEDHVNFYMSMIHDFGDIQDIVYKTEEDSKYRLKVQLLKKDALLVPAPSPEEILVVEIDLDPENPKYLKRALGMGALICYIKR